MSMPEKASIFLESTPEYSLPFGVPYLGMGSSYFAPLAFKHMGLPIYPELASEFHDYLHAGEKIPLGVLLSQSGRSSEVLWCSRLFERYIAISNDTGSPLCKFSNTDSVIALAAGEEKYSSSKTYINTLLSLFRGFGMNMRSAVEMLHGKIQDYRRQGSDLADAVFQQLETNPATGMYITGSGPNIATALQAALICSETSKLNFTGMPMAQYDHGPKETARNSIVIQIISKGRSYARARDLANIITAAGAKVFMIESRGVEENESILHNIIPLNFFAYYLARKLKVEDTFEVGGKVTEVRSSASENKNG